MPCYDGGQSADYDARRERQLEDTIDKRNAMLCAIFNAAYSKNGVKAMLDALDYKECGLNREDFEVWWEEHIEEDRERRRAIAAAKKHKNDLAVKKKARKELIATLTPEQLELLGVK
jgi:hypothetical protein